MNRIDRLTAILLLLQTGKRTAREIAQRFEVSRRTIQRDIDALCEIGIPVASEVGISGGYSLPPDFSLPPLALTLHEAFLMHLALSSLSQLSETPFKQERQSLLAKMQFLTARYEGENLNKLQEALSLDVPSRPYPTPSLDHLLKSTHAQQWLSVTYRSETGVSQQTLLPMRIRTQNGLWYCEAYSHERQAIRIYRVDRFLNVTEAESSPQLEHPVSPIVHAHPSFPEIHVHLTARGILRLERQPYLIAYVQHQQDGEGVLKVRLRREEYDWLVGILLSLGTDAKVVAPEELRRRVLQTAQEIASQYN